MLRLSGGTTFLGSSRLLDRMYIRDDYVGLWSEIQRLVSSGLSRIVVSGNPGIGKSWFGLYIAHQLLSRKSPPVVVWEARLSGTRTLIRDGRVLDGSLDDFRTELNNTSAWYLVDEAVFPGAMRVEAKTLVFSSPKRDNYRLTLKATASTIRYLPPWSWDEIEACHALLYADDPDRPLAEVSDAFERWGGIPRFVLEKLRDGAAQLELQKAIASTGNVDSLVRSVGQIDSAPESSHRVLHMMTSKPYIDVDLQFGSEYIQACVTELLLDQQRADLNRFVMRGTNPLYGTIRGKCFEVLAHEQLVSGGEFPTRMLTSSTGGRSTRLFQRTTSQRFPGNRPEDLVALRNEPAGGYWRPPALNFPVIDALMLPNILFQMTVSEKHDVDESKLKIILGALSLDSAELLFVVPPDKFTVFQAYKFKDSNLAKCITQQALCMAFDVVIR